MTERRSAGLTGKEIFKYVAVVQEVNMDRQTALIRFLPNMHPPRKYNHQRTYKWPFDHLKKATSVSKLAQFRNHAIENFMNCDSWNDEEREAPEPTNQWNQDEMVS